MFLTINKQHLESLNVIHHSFSVGFIRHGARDKKNTNLIVNIHTNLSPCAHSVHFVQDLDVCVLFLLGHKQTK